MESLLEIERRLGRVRRGVRHEPRTIDLDLIFHGGRRMRTRRLTLPHARYREREFVLTPMRELQLGWR
jgi:2-amino-4-hydroxy-6-hydroxymethyldihydropteridine diphosphokinase